MNSDHATPWSNGGTTDTKNREMFYRSHKRSIGNKKNMSGQTTKERTPACNSTYPKVAVSRSCVKLTLAFRL
jgi:hypothetical protein